MLKRELPVGPAPEGLRPQRPVYFQRCLLVLLLILNLLVLFSLKGPESLRRGSSQSDMAVKRESEMAGRGGGRPRSGLRASDSRDRPWRVPRPLHFGPIIICSCQPLSFTIANRLGSANLVDESQAGRRSQGPPLGPALTSCVAWSCALLHSGSLCFLYKLRNLTQGFL